MATMKLTDGLVEGLTATGRDTYVWDTVLPRLGVRVTAPGAKGQSSRILLVQYTVKPAPGAKAFKRRIIIGRYDGTLWNVTKARAAAKKILATVDLGRDPFAEREAERSSFASEKAAAELEKQRLALAAEAMARDRFEAVAARYIETALNRRRSGAEVARLICHGPVKAWAGRHVASIRRAEVAELIDATKQRSPAAARLTYAALRGLFGWCVERELIDTSPCDRLKAPPRPQARDRVLSTPELRAIWRAADGLGFPFAPIVRLLMLTGQRRAEVAGMAWAEIDLVAATWRIPKERTKNAKAHEIDLSPQALAILKTIPRQGPLLFAARRAPARKGENAGERPEIAGPVRGFSATKRRLDELIAEAGPMEPWRLHDLRRTAATGMAAHGVAPHVIERVLNHISGAQGGLVGVYQRFDYRDERRAALIAWGAQVAEIVADKGGGDAPQAGGDRAEAAPEPVKPAAPSNVIRLRA